jgi:cell division protein FtsB
MRRLGWLLLVLLMLLGWLQYRLWFSDGSWGEVTALENQVSHQRRENQGLQERNNALAAEVEDLKSGEAAVEERARSELGMIKPGETFHRVVETVPRGAAPTPLDEDATTDADPEPQP